MRLAIMKCSQMLQENHTNPDLRIVLYQPDIPGNTGSILRFAACMGLTVDIIEPAGFRIDDKSLQRAGMDYAERATLHRHDEWEQFSIWRNEQKRRLVLITTQAQKTYRDFQFRSNDCLLFGRESAGVPQNVHDSAAERLVIPMQTGFRSINLAMSVSMVAGEALGQTG